MYAIPEGLRQPCHTDERRIRWRSAPPWRPDPSLDAIGTRGGTGGRAPLARIGDAAHVPRRLVSRLLSVRRRRGRCARPDIAATHRMAAPRRWPPSASPHRWMPRAVEQCSAPVIWPVARHVRESRGMDWHRGLASTAPRSCPVVSWSVARRTPDHAVPCQRHTARCHHGRCASSDTTVASRGIAVPVASVSPAASADTACDGAALRPGDLTHRSVRSGLEGHGRAPRPWPMRARGARPLTAHIEDRITGKNPQPARSFLTKTGYSLALPHCKAPKTQHTA